MAKPVDSNYGGLLWPDASGVGDAVSDAAAQAALEGWSKAGAEDEASGVDLGELPDIIKAVAKGATDVIKTTGDVVRGNDGGSTPASPPMTQPPVVASTPPPTAPPVRTSPPLAPAKQFPTAAVVGGAVLVVGVVAVIAVAVSSGRRKRRAEGL